jgi:putative flippase GtrA
MGFGASRRFGRFALVGLASNLLCYLVFLALLRARVSPVLANAFCYLLGLAVGYVANRHWTFRSRNRHLADLSRYGIAYALGFLVSVATMSLLIPFMAAPLAQIVTIGVTAVFIYGTLQLLRFGRPGAGSYRATQ